PRLADARHADAGRRGAAVARGELLERVHQPLELALHELAQRRQPRLLSRDPEDLHRVDERVERLAELVRDRAGERLPRPLGFAQRVLVARLARGERASLADRLLRAPLAVPER